MLFVVRFIDRPDRREVREHHLDEHLRWLEHHRSSILAAGSLRVDADAFPMGALWIVDAADKAEVDALLRTDPFWIEGLRESYDVLHWSKGFATGIPV